MSAVATRFVIKRITVLILSANLVSRNEHPRAVRARFRFEQRIREYCHKSWKTERDCSEIAPRCSVV